MTRYIKESYLRFKIVRRLNCVSLNALRVYFMDGTVWVLQVKGDTIAVSGEGDAEMGNDVK